MVPNGTNWILPNSLSLARIGLALGFPLVPPGWRAASVMAAAISDLFDGRLSRALNGTSTFGQILDPLADKLFVGIVLITLVIGGVLSPWRVAADRVPRPRRPGGLDLVGAPAGLGVAPPHAPVTPGQARHGRAVRFPPAPDSWYGYGSHHLAVPADRGGRDGASASSRDSTTLAGRTHVTADHETS